MRNPSKCLHIQVGSLDKQSELNLDHLSKFDGGGGKLVTGIQKTTETTVRDDTVYTRKPMEGEKKVRLLIKIQNAVSL